MQATHDTITTTRAAWLTKATQVAPSLRLVCFPYAGGSAASFAGWQEALGRDIELRVVQLPGRGVRWMEPAQAHLPTMLGELAEALPPALDGLPFAFFGHSMGGLLAFELCRQLAARDTVQPRHLFISGCQAPAHRKPFPRHYALPDAALIEVLRDYGGTPEELLHDAELMALLLPAIRADFQLVADHRYTRAAPLPIPLTVLYGHDDTIDDPRCISGWKNESNSGSEFLGFDGDHFFLHSAQAAVIDSVRHALSPHLERKVC